MPQPKPKLVMHVGLHKTGTSYLQQLIASNLDVLSQAGYTPAPLFHERRGQHHQLAEVLRRDGATRFFETLRFVDTSSIITSEMLIHWIASADRKQLADFAELLMRQFDIRVVIFLRRQDFLKESVFAEVASHWYCGSIADESHYSYDFDALLKRMEAVFGQQRIGVGIFRDLHPKDLLGEFLNAAAIDTPLSRFRSIPPVRVSPSRRKVALLAHVH